MTVGVPQGSCLSPLLFIMVVEAISQEFQTEYTWENMYAGDLVIITESLEEMHQKLILVVVPVGSARNVVAFMAI